VLVFVSVPLLSFSLSVALHVCSGAAADWEGQIDTESDEDDGSCGDDGRSRTSLRDAREILL
jgi:hypothetical protein